MNLRPTFIVLLFFFCFGCGDTTGPTGPLQPVTIATSTVALSSSIYLAQKKGFFKAEGLDVTVEIHSAGRLALQQVLDGKADLCTVAETPVAHAAVNGTPVVILATLGHSDKNTQLICRKDRGIATVQDLRGKRIGVVKGTSAEFFLSSYLLFKGIPSEALQIVYLTPAEVPEALVNGTVDAGATWDPITVQIRRKLGDNALVFHSEGLYGFRWNLATSADLVKPKAETFQKVLRALLRATAELKIKNDEAIAASTEYTRLPPEDFREVWDTMAFDIGLDQALIMSLEAESRWILRSQGKSDDATPNFLKYIAPEALDKVAPHANRLIR